MYYFRQAHCHLFISWLIVSIVKFGEVKGGDFENQLIHDLMSNYSRLVRPSAIDKMPLEIKFGIIVNQIMELNEKEEIIETNLWLDYDWNDCYLRWDPQKYGGITSFRIRPDNIWMPDILLYNSANSNFDSAVPSNVIVMFDGTISYIPPGMFKSSCTINIRWFPFDEQNCEMKFGSWTYKGNELALLMKTNVTSADLSTYIKHGEWDLLGVPGERHRLEFMGDYYDDVTFTIKIRRRPLYYIFNLIIPCIFVSCIALLTYTVPADAGEKIGLAMNILLCMIFMSLLIAEMLPASDGQPILGIYFATMLLMSALVVVFTILVLNFRHRTAATHHLPNWVRTVINVWLAWILRMKRPGKNLSRQYFLTQLPEDDTNEDNRTNGMQTKKCQNLKGFDNTMYNSETNDKTTAFGDTTIMKNYPPPSNRVLTSPLSDSELLYAGMEMPSAPRNLLTPPTSGNSDTAGILPESPLIFPKGGTSICNTDSNVLPGKDVNMKKPKEVFRKYPTLYPIYKELKFIADRWRQEDIDDEINAEWVFAAMVLDRLCLIVFSMFTVISTAAILLAAPNIFTNDSENEPIGN